MGWSYEQEWYEETNVARKIKNFLEATGWEIEKFNEDKRARGPDIIAIKEGHRLIVEVKGFPSERYVRGPKKGQLKPTPSNLQAKHWFAEALLSLIIKKNQMPDVEIALGLPDFPKYRELIDGVNCLRKAIGLRFFIVRRNGQVEVMW